MFIVVLFLIAENWKQSKCPTKSEWIKCGTPIQWNTTSAIKKEQTTDTCS